jgi:hypothetical protein
VVLRQKDLPANIDKSFSVYEITLAQGTPTPTYLNLKEDLTAFRIVYQQVLRQIHSDKPEIKELHLFPAVPAPIAVLCGRELLPKVDPTLVVYDFQKDKGGFIKTLRIN